MPDRPAEATADEIAGADLLLAARRMGLDAEGTAAALCTALWQLAHALQEPERRLIAEMVFRAADEIAAPRRDGR